MSGAATDLIVVRRLTESDLGLFEAQRDRIKSKQRAIGINAAAAKRILGNSAYEAGGVDLGCTCVHAGLVIRASRPLRKIHKNWRLGGPKISGQAFGRLRAGDFALLRCLASDQCSPLALSFVAKGDPSVAHDGLSAIVGPLLNDGVAVFEESSEQFADLVHLCPREFIVVRSLAESDLGVFGALRATVKCKQRAFNINAVIAERLLSPQLFDAGGATLECRCRFSGRNADGRRPLTKVNKNWRLGGPVLPGSEFSDVGCKDFLLIRAVEWNTGAYPLNLAFITKKRHRVAHAGIASALQEHFTNSMVAIHHAQPLFERIAPHCPVPNGKHPV